MLAALAVKDVGARDRPGGRVMRIFPARLPWGDPAAFAVAGGPVEASGTAWYKLGLPSRPNGSTGWVPAAQVRIVPVAAAARIDLSRRVLTLEREGRAVASFSVVVGAPGTPTPTGSFFVSLKLRPPRLEPLYGSVALGLSAWSDVLDQFGTGDGQIALHGTADVSSLGSARSHGCVRLGERDLGLLDRLLSLGARVTVVP
jgi:lipoprotein-anchoring transpeptidase ErfK/SrfK